MLKECDFRVTDKVSSITVKRVHPMLECISATGWTLEIALEGGVTVVHPNPTAEEVVEAVTLFAEEGLDTVYAKSRHEPAAGRVWTAEYYFTVSEEEEK